MTSSNIEIFSALLTICAGNSPVTGEFPAQRPVTRSFDVLFNLRLNKWLSKQWWGWWFETPPRPLWRHSNVIVEKRKEISIYFLCFLKWIQRTRVKCFTAHARAHDRARGQYPVWRCRNLWRHLGHLNRCCWEFLSSWFHVRSTSYLLTWGIGMVGWLWVRVHNKRHVQDIPYRIHKMWSCLDLLLYYQLPTDLYALFTPVLQGCFTGTDWPTACEPCE